MVTAEIEVSRDGQPLINMYPARHFYFGREDEPTTEVALRRGVAEDFYVVLASYDVAQQEAHLHLKVNPLVNWIWFGVGIMVIGTFIAFLPERAIAFATRRVPEGVVTTSLVLLIVAGAGRVHLHAQHVEQKTAVFAPPTSQLERDMRAHIVCMCGGCGRQRIGECTCPKAAEMRDKVATLAAAGKNRDEILQEFVTEYGR